MKQIGSLRRLSREFIRFQKRPRIWSAFIIFVSWIIFYVYTKNSIHINQTLNSFICSETSERGVCSLFQNQAFAISFQASALQDLVFITFIGVALALLLGARPESLNLNGRLSILLNEIVDSNARAHASLMIQNQLSYAESAEIVFQFDKILKKKDRRSSKSTDIVSCRVEFVQFIQNMSANDRFPARWTHDVVAGQTWKGSAGTVSEVSITDEKEPWAPSRIVPDPPIHLDPSKPTRIQVNFEIAEGSRVKFVYKFQLFDRLKDHATPDDNTIFCTLRRYTRICHVYVENKTGHTINIIDQHGKKYIIANDQKDSVSTLYDQPEETIVPISVVSYH